MSRLTTTFRAGARVPAWVLRTSHGRRVRLLWGCPVQVVRDRAGHVTFTPLAAPRRPYGGVVQLRANPRALRLRPWPRGFALRGAPTHWRPMAGAGG